MRPNLPENRAVPAESARFLRGFPTDLAVQQLYYTTISPTSTPVPPTNTPVPVRYHRSARRPRHRGQQPTGQAKRPPAPGTPAPPLQRSASPRHSCVYTISIKVSSGPIPACAWVKRLSMDFSAFVWTIPPRPWGNGLIVQSVCSVQPPLPTRLGGTLRGPPALPGEGDQPAAQGEPRSPPIARRWDQSASRRSPSKSPRPTTRTCPGPAAWSSSRSTRLCSVTVRLLFLSRV